MLWRVKCWILGFEGRRGVCGIEKVGQVRVLGVGVVFCGVSCVIVGGVRRSGRWRVVVVGNRE